MKYAFAAVALAALARAQSLADLPECAQPCLETAIQDNTSCEVSDLECVCKEFDAVQGDATACVLKECGSATAINDVLPAAEALCAGGGSGGEEQSSAAEETPEETSTAEEAPEETEPITDSPEPTPIPLPTPIEEPETPEETDVVAPPADEPEVSPVPTAAAAHVGAMGSLAMVVLGALAL